METPRSAATLDDVSITQLSIASWLTLLGLLAGAIGVTWAAAMQYQTLFHPHDDSKQVKDLQNEVDRLKGDLGAAQQQVSELTKSLTDARAQLRARGTDGSGQQAEVNKTLTQQLEQARQQQRDLEARLNEAKDREGELNKKVPDLQNQLREAPRGGGGSIVRGRDEGGPRADAGSCLQLQPQWASQRSALGDPEALKWNVNANQIRTRIDQRFLYSCPANGSIVSVYGGARGIYGTGSGICAAAVHRGLISASDGGMVAIKVDGGAEQLIRGGQDHGVSASYVNGGSSTFHFIDPVSGGELACK